MNGRLVRFLILLLFVCTSVNASSVHHEARTQKSWCRLALESAACLVVAGAMGCSAAQERAPLEDLQANAIETKSNLDEVDLDGHLESHAEGVRETIHAAIQAELVLGDHFVAELERGVPGSRVRATEAFQRALQYAQESRTVVIKDILPKNDLNGLKWAWNHIDGHGVPLYIQDERRFRPFSNDRITAAGARNFLKVLPIGWWWSVPETALGGLFDLFLGWTYTDQHHSVAVTADPRHITVIQERLNRLNALSPDYEQQQAHAASNTNVQILMTYHFTSPDPEYLVQIQSFLGSDIFIVPGNRQDGTPFENKWNELKTAIEQLGALKDQRSEIVEETEFGSIQVTIRARAFVPPDRVMAFFNQHRRYQEGERDRLTIQITPYQAGQDAQTEEMRDVLSDDDRK